MQSGLDPRFICTSDLEELMRDKDSGLPLAGGIVTFYSDINRSVLKPVYQLTGSPPNYSYSVLPNPCTLSTVGTFQDGLGNNIVPFYYPFIGTPSQNTGEQELYYITVVSSGFVPQFTRQGWPQAAADQGGTPGENNTLENFIPNGQFLAHNNWVSLTEPPVTEYAFGAQTVDSQAIAQGGWNFVYTKSTTAVFNHSFSTIPSSGGWNTNNFPRYSFNFVCTSFNANAQTRDLRIQWRDVNKFSAGYKTAVQPYTLYFDAKSNDSNSYTFIIYQMYYFGTGGSPSSPITTTLATITINPSSQNFNIPIPLGFPANQGTIGSNNDDYVAISIRGPASTWNVQMSDFALVSGIQTLTSFPTLTNAEMLSEGVAGWMPTPDPMGQDLYLPLILTTQGMTFDHSCVGEIWGSVNSNITSANSPSLLCDGSSYITNNYSALGIPYSRLYNQLSNTVTGMMPWGTGNFANVSINSGNTAELVLGINPSGTQTAPADGSATTGFDFTTTAPRSNTAATSTSYKAYSNSSGVINFISGFSSGPSGGVSFAAGTSGMTFTNWNQALAGSFYGVYTTALSASALAAGSSNPAKYFTFETAGGAYYAWFYINGETDPAPGGTGIRINLVSTMAIADVANIISYVINQSQTYTIICTSAATVAAGSWFQFNVGTSLYVVWYMVASAGTVPVVAGSTAYIQATLVGTETADQVAVITQKAINAYSYAVPNLAGMFLRGTDPTAIWDIDNSSRWSTNNVLPYTSPGTFEFYTNENHFHTSVLPQQHSGTSAASFGTGGGGTPTNFGVNTNNIGGSETRPVNFAVNWFIKY